MCIICNASAGKDSEVTVDIANEFLHHFHASQQAMQKAASRMLALSQFVGMPEDRKRYDRTHKQMVRLLKEWNSIEHQREKDDPPTDANRLALQEYSNPTDRPEVAQWKENLGG